MSHELRTPLNSILGFTQVLAARADLGMEERRFVDLIGDAGQRLLGTVNDVLDLSKIEAGAISLHITPVDLRVLVGRTMDLVRQQAEEKGLTAALDLPEAPVLVRADADRIRQILLNLLGNALKFTAAGSISAALRSTEAEGGIAVEIAVTDSGIGIPAHRIDRMFRRFEQADGSISRRYGGTGLGLSICRSLAELMGGSVDVVSTPGHGSCFVLRLVLPPASDMRADQVAAPDMAGLALAGYRVLVAEDVILNQELISIFLKPCAMLIDFVANGVDAVSAAASIGYDMILMDMQMPVMDGLEAARRIRGGGGPSARAPIIALTANVLAAEMQRCLESGMDDHVSKPFTAASLRAALCRWAGQASKQGSAKYQPEV